MKRVLFITALIWLVAGVAVVGCSPASEKPPADKNGEIEIRLAPIEEVQVRIAESFPPQIFVYIRGGLADGCTTFHEEKVERSGNIISINVTTQRPKDAVCTQVYGTFERNVALGSDFTSGVTYTVNVNDAKPVAFVAQ